MGKFHKDEIAISVNHGPNVAAKYGAHCECTILDVGPFRRWQRHHLIPPGTCLSESDYLIKMPDGEIFCALEIYLRKRPQPGLDHFRSELKSADPSLWPPGIDLDRLRNPALTEPMVREGLKGILQPFGFEGAV